MESFYVTLEHRGLLPSSEIRAVNLYQNSPRMFVLLHATVKVTSVFSVPMTQLGMLGSHFNKHFLLVTLFVKLFISIINPFPRETIFRINTDHIEASTATWSCILDITLFMILAPIVNAPFARQAFLWVSN